MTTATATNVFRELNSGFVVDRNELNKLPTTQLNDQLASLYVTGKKVIMVDSFSKFFSLNSLTTALNENDPSLELILEFNQVQLDSKDLEVISEFGNVKNRVMNIIAEIRSAKATVKYPFTAVPEGWSVETSLLFKQRSISRAHNDASDYEYRDGYCIGLTTSERLWSWVAPYWANNIKKTDLPSHSVRTSYGHYGASAYPNNISVGCQRIRRYELEQLAASKGWAFPEISNLLGIDDIDETE